MACTLRAMIQTVAASDVSQKGLRVFLVEDSPAVRERLEEMVESISGAHSIGFAVSAGQAIREILAKLPDAVVLDISLEQGSGFDVLRAVHDAAPDIAIYMLSNYATEPYRRLAERLGATEFFDKSAELNSILGRGSAIEGNLKVQSSMRVDGRALEVLSGQAGTASFSPLVLPVATGLFTVLVVFAVIGASSLFRHERQTTTAA